MDPFNLKMCCFFFLPFGTLRQRETEREKMESIRENDRRIERQAFSKGMKRERKRVRYIYIYIYTYIYIYIITYIERDSP